MIAKPNNGDPDIRSAAQAVLDATAQTKSGEWIITGDGEVLIGALADILSSRPRLDAGEPTFQARVKPWLHECFGPEISADRPERNDRFIEEALELVQASGYTAERAHQLVEYVFSRPQGDINQEVGGVMITLAAHCLAHGVDMHQAGETELARIWTKVEQIRAKHAAKPKHSALPIAAPEPKGAVPADVLERVSKALEPFANDAAGIHPEWSAERRRVSLTQAGRLTVGDFRTARSAKAEIDAILGENNG